MAAQNNPQGRLRMADIHCHILPGVDDGSSDWEESTRMLRLTYEQGVRTLIATPHCGARFHIQDTVRLQALTEELKEKARELAPDMDIYLGEEIFYFDDIVTCLENGELLTLAGSRYVLIEFEPSVAYSRINRAVRQILSGGYLPVLAHIERYLCLHDFKKLEELSGSGCYMQMNAASLSGGFFDRRAAWCRKVVLGGYIHFVATDMHNSSNRPPNLASAFAWLDKHADEEQAYNLLRGNQKYILGNRVL